MTNNTSRILVISEEEQLTKSLTSDLELLGYSPYNKNYDDLEIGKILRLDPDVIFFDLTVWDENVLQIYKGLKSNTKLENLGIVFIILISDSSLSKLSYTLEFDELIVMPYKARVLDLRVKRLLWQKNKVVDQEIIKIDDLCIYLASYQVSVKGNPVDLTLKEYELLKYLATHRGRAFNRETLLNIIWGYDYYGGTRTVDVHIRRIRSKIGEVQENYIKTIRGVGYMFRE